MRGRMSLPRLIVRMARYRLWLVAVPMLAGTVALALNLMAAPRYTAMARLLPPRTNTATAQSMLNQIGGTETIGASALTLKSPSELYASLFLSRSVQDSIIAGFDLAERYGESDIDALLKLVGLDERRHWPARQLAHGEKQWLEIGMLLASDPQVLLIDEPAAGMTDDETKRTGELLLSLAGKHSLVVIEHDMTFVKQIARDSEVTVLHQGSVLFEGKFDEVQSNQKVREVYLGRGKHTD